MTRRLGAVLVLLLAFLWLPALPATAAGATVTIGSTLNPRSLTVAPGTTVTWRNADSERHRIRSESGPAELDSDDLEPGGTWSFTFSAAGTYRYVDHRDDENSAYWGTVTVSSSSSGGGTGGGGTGGGGGGGTAPAAPSTASVSMAGRAFSPSSVRIAAGGTVTFVNDDDDEHTVTANDGSFDSGVMNAGARWSRRFPSAGTFRYLCAIHPDMTGTVAVGSASGSVPPPAPSAPRPPGSGGSVGSGGSGGAATGAPPSRPGSARVDVLDFAYAPARLSVHVGDTVSFVNVGRAPHTVTAPGFGTPMLAAGATWRTVAGKVGRIAYLCTFHPQMTGVLEVLPATAKLPAPVAAAAPPALAAPPSASASPAPPPSAAASPSAQAETAVDAPRRTRTVAAESMWSSPIVTWTLWGGIALVAFLSVAWWRGREPVQQ